MKRFAIVLLTMGALPVLFTPPAARAQDREEAERRLSEIRHEIEDLRAAHKEVPESLVDTLHALERRLEGGDRNRGQGDRGLGLRRRGGEGRSRFGRSDDQRRPRRGRPDREEIEVELRNLRNEFEEVERHLGELRERDRDIPRELGESAEHLQHRIHELEQVLARRGDRAEGQRRGGGRQRLGHGRPGRGPGRESMRGRGPGGQRGPSRFGPGPGGSRDGLRLFADIAPEEAEELQRLRREDRREFFMRMREIMPEMGRLMALKERDPEAFERTIHERKIEHRAMRLAHEAREAEGERREELAEQARAHLDELFDVRMRDRDARIEQLEHELERLRHEQEQRREHRGELIERRLAELMGEAIEF